MERGPFPGTAVSVLDADSGRRARIVRLVEALGCRAVEAPSTAIAAPGPAVVALLAVDAAPGPHEAVLSAIGAGCGQGRQVLCYAAGARDWPVAARCRLLLAGAVAVLEWGDAAFAADLRHWLSRLLTADRLRRAEDEEVRGAMLAAGIVAGSPAMMGVLRWVLKVSCLSDLPALIGGETGTGKELVARAIHQLDAKRCHGPFVAVNCSAISPELAESELFGHRKGAFTGAAQERKGLFRAADGGVLFLDEIGDMRLDLQGKLLRALQEGTVLGVGEDRETPVDVRVVAATNRDLEAEAGEGRFRSDLFHRLAVLSVRVPPLRERREDIPLLVDHFLAVHRPLAPHGPHAVGPAFLEALAEAPLPGNVRELENLVRSAMVSKADESALDLGDLPPRVLGQLAVAPDGPAAAAGAAGEGASSAGALLVDLLIRNGWNLARTLDDLERALLEAAISAAHGNQAQMARLLGVTPRCIYSKLRKHGLVAKARA